MITGSRLDEFVKPCVSCKRARCENNKTGRESESELAWRTHPQVLFLSFQLCLTACRGGDRRWKDRRQDGGGAASAEPTASTLTRKQGWMHFHLPQMISLEVAWNSRWRPREVKIHATYHNPMSSLSANLYARSWVKLDLVSKDSKDPGFTQPLRDPFSVPSRLGLLMCVILSSPIRSKGAINLSRSTSKGGNWNFGLERVR